LYARSTKTKLVALLILPLASFLAVAQPATLHVGGNVLDPQGHRAETGDDTYSTQLSGTVVDTSGAVIDGATVQIQNAKRHCRKNDTVGD